MSKMNSFFFCLVVLVGALVSQKASAGCDFHTYPCPERTIRPFIVGVDFYGSPHKLGMVNLEFGWQFVGEGATGFGLSTQFGVGGKKLIHEVPDSTPYVTTMRNSGLADIHIGFMKQNPSRLVLSLGGGIDSAMMRTMPFALGRAVIRLAPYDYYRADVHFVIDIGINFDYSRYIHPVVEWVYNDPRIHTDEYAGSEMRFAVAPQLGVGWMW